MKLDMLDMKILEALQNPQMLAPKLSDIAKSVGTTNATVYRRIVSLKKANVILGHTTNIDSRLIGKSLKAFIYLNLAKPLLPEEKQKVASRLAEMDVVEAAYEPIGKWTYIIKTSHGDIGSLNTFMKNEISKIPCDDVQVDIILNVVKEGHTSLRD